MSGEQLGGLALGLIAVLFGAGGIAAAIRTRRRRADIAATYGATGGIVYTIVSGGGSSVLVLGGFGFIGGGRVARPWLGCFCPPLTPLSGRLVTFRSFTRGPL